MAAKIFGGKTQAQTQGVRGIFDGAGFGADVACKPTFSHSADASILADRQVLAARAKDLIRNDGMIKNGLDILCDTVIGPGLKFLCTPDHEHLGISKEAADHFASQLKRVLRNWGNSSDHTNDAQLKLSWGRQQWVAFRSMMTTGDTLAALRYLPDHGKLGTAVQLINPDRLQSPPDFGAQSNLVRGGVQVDYLGAAIGYHILPDHPSDLRAGMWQRFLQRPNYHSRWTENGLRQILHVFEAHEEDQNRGVSIFAQSIIIANQMKTYREAELQSATPRSTGADAAAVAENVKLKAQVETQATELDDLKKRLAGLEKSLGGGGETPSPADESAAGTSDGESADNDGLGGQP